MTKSEREITAGLHRCETEGSTTMLFSVEG